MKPQVRRSKYAIKRHSGGMMYGPVTAAPKSPQWRAPYVPPYKYWWGEPRKTTRGASDEE